MKIILERQIEVKKYKAILDIGEKQSRTDVVAVIKIANHHNNQITEKILCDEFIFRNNKNIAKRIIRRCQDFGVINDEGNLTLEGIQALTDEKIFHPRTGVYYIWVTQDPLIPQKLLNIQLIDENINFRDEINAEKRAKYSKFENNKIKSAKIENLPEWIQKITKKSNITLFDKKKREVKIENIEKKVEISSESQILNGKIVITKNQSILELEGLFTDIRQFSNFPSFKSVWEKLLENKIRNWDWKTSKLSRPLKKVSEIEKKELRTQIYFNNPTISDFGSFNSFKSPVIKIEPINEEEANLWANWLFDENISEYIFISNFENLKNLIQEKFTRFTIKFNTREKIQKNLENYHTNIEIPDRYWYITAPIDLIPISTHPEERK